jgi:hypothetical protein
MANVREKIGETYSTTDHKGLTVKFQITGIYFEKACSITANCCQNKYGVEILILESNDPTEKIGDKKKFVKCCGIIENAKLVSPAVFSPQHGDWVQWQGKKYRVALSEQEVGELNTGWEVNTIIIEFGSGWGWQKWLEKYYIKERGTNFYAIKTTQCTPCSAPVEEVRAFKIGDRVEVINEKLEWSKFIGIKGIVKDIIDIHNGESIAIPAQFGSQTGDILTIKRISSRMCHGVCIGGYHDWFEPYTEPPKSAMEAKEDLQAWNIVRVAPIAPIAPGSRKSSTTLIGKYFDKAIK